MPKKTATEQEGLFVAYYSKLLMASRGGLLSEMAELAATPQELGALRAFKALPLGVFRGYMVAGMIAQIYARICVEQARHYEEIKRP